MIAFCRRRRQAIITVGGAGGQRDPTRVRDQRPAPHGAGSAAGAYAQVVASGLWLSGQPQAPFPGPQRVSDEPQLAPPDSCDPVASRLTELWRIRRLYAGNRQLRHGGGWVCDRPPGKRPGQRSRLTDGRQRFTPVRVRHRPR